MCRERFKRMVIASSKHSQAKAKSHASFIEAHADSHPEEWMILNRIIVIQPRIVCQK